MNLSMKSNSKDLTGAGILLLILGIGAWILPIIGFQLKFILTFTEILGIPIEVLTAVLVVLGVIFIYFGRKQAEAENKTSRKLEK